LNEQSRSLLVEISSLKERLEGCQGPAVGMKAALEALQPRMKSLITAVTRHKRTPATHVLVTMISPNERNRKPYALPISCIPYVGLTETRARAHISQVVKQMCKQGLLVEGIFCNFIVPDTLYNYIGFVSNGEYNVFRHKGYTRPLSVFQIQSLARRKYSSFSVQKMKEMFTIGKKNLCSDI